MSTVLAALASDAAAAPVLSAAVAIAGLFDASVTALHVREHGTTVPHELATAAGVELYERHGSPIEQITAACQKPDVAALVLGARGIHGGAQPAGHTVLQVITQVSKPVLVVPPHAQPRQSLARILVALDGTTDTAHALREIITLAHAHRLKIFVLHVYSPDTVPAFADHAPHATHAREREFLSRNIAAPHDRVTLLHHLGVAADDIAAAARETNADLIALAWRQNLTRGSAHVISQTLAHSKIPVLLLPVS
jgi:nucleotide-binding universal stress UspA family protein